MACYKDCLPDRTPKTFCKMNVETRHFFYPKKTESKFFGINRCLQRGGISLSKDQLGISWYFFIELWHRPGPGSRSNNWRVSEQKICTSVFLSFPMGDWLSLSSFTSKQHVFVWCSTEQGSHCISQVGARLHPSAVALWVTELQSAPSSPALKDDHKFWCGNSSSHYTPSVPSTPIIQCCICAGRLSAFRTLTTALYKGPY